ncbi:MAG: site-specific DNA-methyltransferase [Coriobacteriales bacterium]|jgi:adenine-specific DNA-methyltransferase|nr:site-specific DNA-methyltransferase [Coriobacteriales bacterium]
MDKLKMQTANLADANFAALAALFPNAVTETIDENGTVVRAIDKDVLAQEISAHVVDGREERYQFTWPDKRKSVLLANAPIAAALRPCREESVDFDTTENLYIEGDNLDVLKLLRETYLNRVKMIYIDPPYNTGNDFVYDDDFSESASDYAARSGDYDEQGNRLVKNLDSNGRFHTDWLNMIYPRLRVARDLLADDGVIFISIDDGEVSQLRRVCDDIFGASNFVANIVWQKKYGPANDSTTISPTHDHILSYAKSIMNWHMGFLPRNTNQMGAFKNPDNDPRGLWRASDLSARTYSATCDYVIKSPTGEEFRPPASRSWIVNPQRYAELLADNRITFGTSGNGRPMQKKFLSEVREGITPETWWTREFADDNKNARYEMKALFPENVFDTPKPSKLVYRLLQVANVQSDAIILDFFSGSATTAHAVMQLNAEDGGKRKFIMVQLPEVCDEKSEAAKAGYSTICEIGKERIRRAGAKIKAELGIRNAELKNEQLSLDGNSKFQTPNSELDVGFRVLKLDSSNMKDVYYTPEEYTQTGLSFDGFADNIKADRTPKDLLFQVMLDLGIPLSSPIMNLEFGMRNENNSEFTEVFDVANGYLIACFTQVDTAMITEIAQKKPYYAVFRDSSFASDSAMVNFEQVFNTYSPNTIRRVL